VTYYDGRMVYRYFSKLDPERGFCTAEEARKNDRATAIVLLSSTSTSGFRAAFEERDDKLVALFKFLADEMGAAPPATSPAETETT